MAAAPRGRQVDPGLGAEQPGAGGGDGLGPDVALVHMPEPIACQRRSARLQHRPEPDVAGLRHEHRGDGDREVLDARASAGDVRELVQVAGPVVHLEQQLGQVDPRQHSRDQAPQRHQGWRLRLRGEALELDPVAARHDLESAVVGQSARHRAVLRVAAATPRLVDPAA